MRMRPVWLDEAGLQQLFAATRAAGGEARAVGGAVRDALMGRKGSDVDVASSLLPEQTMALAAELGWKAIPTGLAHGTVTLVLPERVVEVTTLRRDISTDGRHAKVAFTDSFAADALRRDFTINALYLDAEGQLYDFVNGQQDLAARQVRFIGEARLRIQEDGLRILRFFRFLAMCGGTSADEEALAAIRELRTMLTGLSGERIAAEMQKLLQADVPFYAVEMMEKIGLSTLLTETSWQLHSFARLLQHEAQYAVRAGVWARLLALVSPETRAEAARFVSDRWKLSREERAQLVILSAPSSVTAGQKGIFHDAGDEDSPPCSNDGMGVQGYTVDSAVVKEWLRAYPRVLVSSRVLLAAADGALLASPGTFLRLVREWEIPVFPLKAADLLARGFSEGTALGQALKELEAQWVASDYSSEKDMLLHPHTLALLKS